MAWLDQHPPSRSQYRDPRRETPSGLIVVHTAENVMDKVGPDTGAEGVARFIQSRDTPGSYHDLVDSDSTLHLVRYNCEAFHDGTGSNPHSYGVSFACRTSDWQGMAPAKRDGFIERGAMAAAAYAKWVKSEHGVTVPPSRVSKAQSDKRTPGFISHGQRDPGRRSDPGQEFPWRQFLERFKALMGATPARPTIPTEDDDVSVAVEGPDGKVYATDGITKRHVVDRQQLNELAITGAVKLDPKTGREYLVSQATIDAIPTSS